MLGVLRACQRGLGVAMLRRARHDGLPITCDVGMHHIHLSELDLGYFDPQCRLEP